MTSVPISATYRLQLRGDAFTLDDARAIADYLQRLGVSHLYLSPILTAAEGSQHGYDVTDPTSVSAALGGSAALRALRAELHTRDMGLIVDIVPNHVGVADAAQNAWWWDVLKNGKDSVYADFFDIDWSAENGAGGRIAIGVLDGENDAAALAIDRSGAEPMLAFHDMRFPLAPGTADGNPLAVHDRQAYRLVNWRAGLATYRRFFAVSTLAAVRQEDPRVFDATHSQVAEWVADDIVDGIRVDHPDGLSDPAAYLARLRALLGPNRWLVIEKILGAEEPLDATLPIDGTTGYDALAELGGVFVDPSGETTLTRLVHDRTGVAADAEWLDDTESVLKRTVAQTDLAPEVRRLVAAIARDVPNSGGAVALAVATVEVLASMRVYRADYEPLAGTLTRVVGAVERRKPELTEPLSVLTRALIADGEAATRFSQVCGAVTAKAVEDCLFYRANRLVSLQEVGGDPARFGHSPNEFHLANAERANRWPMAMTTLSTHDTKRGEDVRARIGVLSQAAQEWSDFVAESEKAAPSPDPATGMFLLQNMFGVWPAGGAGVDTVPQLRERIHAYAEKAIREAGAQTTWNDVDTEFEAALHDWLDTIIDGPVGVSMTALVARLAPHGWSDSLGQKLLHLCGPGIPDIYQGTEVWEDSLVDPDNRRLVDFDSRRGLLAAAKEPPPVDGSGAAKLWVVAHALWLRRQRAESFVGGSYTPVFADGERAGHLVGFGRGRPDQAPDVIALGTRHSVRLSETGWGDTALTLPDGEWSDQLSGSTHSGRTDAASLFSRLPVALLVR
ncbi:malto-oligosyltrehalose synthase [Antrihabitans sp. NCIMB 15449]|uniref:Malto-oligosyltrehalose synthase n=1 Tax=Antrihabitans spumae TaxID=3373370 RepID=A0ABW7JSI6_9NOCA